jgi:hypothetical protein
MGAYLHCQRGESKVGNAGGVDIAQIRSLGKSGRTESEDQKGWD